MNILILCIAAFLSGVGLAQMCRDLGIPAWIAIPLSFSFGWILAGVLK